jgi:hypothetical protein
MAKKPKSNMRSDKELQEVLRTWRTLVPAITTLSEAEAQRCIELESEGEQRRDFLMRLHGRYSRLRYERELHTLLRRA